MTRREQVYHYRFGDVVFAVRTPCPLRIRAKYEEFRVPDETPADVTVEVIALPGDSPIGRREPPIVRREGNRIVMEANGEDIPNVAVGNILSLTGAAFVFPERDSFILHASYILYRGKALLFSAPSGTGKSTQAGFWKESRGAEIINGDRALITRRNGEFYANGIYVSGKSGLSRNVSAPLGTVVLLEQGEKNEIRPLKPREKLMRLICQSTYDVNSESQREAILSITADLVSTVPVIGYRCRNHPDSVEELERYLWNERHE